MSPQSSSARTGASSRSSQNTPLTPALLAVMAGACGLGIANLYYSQPLLPEIARTFDATDKEVGILPMLTQGGFALGVFFLAPLGDTVERRRLILTMLGLVTLFLTVAASAPTLQILAAASFAIGITSVISTLVLPFAVQLGRPEERGKTVGTIASALLTGVLLSRTLSGVVGEMFGWRVMYGCAALLMIGLAFTLSRMLPESRPAITLPYWKLIGSMGQLIRDYPLLRQATINGVLLYGALSAFWATLAFLLESPAYHLGPAAAGFFGLVAALGAMAGPIVGRRADKYGGRALIGAAVTTMFAGYLILWGFGTHLAGLIVGVIVLDLAAQAATVSNQATVYSLAPEAQSRMYTIYRASFSMGGSAGAYGGVLAWSSFGWTGVCLLGMTLLTTALALHWSASRGNAKERIAELQTA